MKHWALSFRFVLSLGFILLLVDRSYSQGLEGLHGDVRYTKRGIMDGNLIRTIFFNHGEVADWPSQPSGEWPKGSGHSYLDGATPYVSAEVEDINGNLIHPLVTMYRENIDIGPAGEKWGMHPLPGFANPDQDSPAMSDNINSWPQSWPDKWDDPEDPGWRGINLETGIDPIPEHAVWNGYFGKGLFNAELETYYMADDYQDHEYAFFPDPSDSSRGGLGIRMKVRGFQWSNILAEDVIFWLYDLTNISSYHYPKVLFGMFFDAGVGGTGDSGDDNGLFDRGLDITYAFDLDNIGDTGWGPVGVIGFAYLESPGDPFDGEDNDEDGLINERRDSGPGEWKFGPVGIYGEPKWHWSGDEDGDWRGFEDSNENGVWDPETEPLWDDVGADGVGPLDPNYTGRDRGEGDGIPTPGEPNFDQTDLDESDQIGLTSVDVIVLHDYELQHDEIVWERMQPGSFDTELEPLTNLGIWYASAYFEMPQDYTERFSIALVFGEDIDDLLRNKQTVQQIYNANYRFAGPPLKPHVVAVPGDQKVTLYWDRVAEQSVDPFLGYKNDFEGYVIYRATDPAFLEVRIITDAYGNNTFRKPIAQFDLIDGIYGPDPVGVAGAHFNRGDDTGLKHTFVDSTVENGQTYYYAVVSYDQGDPELGTAGLPPTECTSIIKIDELGQVISTDVNTVEVTPNAPAAGYRLPEITEDVTPVGELAGTGRVWAEIVDPRLIKDNITYHIIFGDTGVFQTESYSVVDVTAPDTVLSRSEFFGRDKHGFLRDGEIFDGLRLFIDNDEGVVLIDSLTGWGPGSSSNFEGEVMLSAGALPYPADYEIEFFDEVVGTDSSSTPKDVNFEVWNITENRWANFRFTDLNGDGLWSSNERITIRERFEGVETRSWRVTLEDTTATGEGAAPEEGDVFFIRTTKPFRAGDAFRFTTKAAHIDLSQAKSSLDRVAVVPNPYVAVASWERKSIFQTGRGERRIDFIHLPQRATIRIYNMKGDLVDIIEHDSPVDDGAASWDMRTREGLDIAFGIYIFHVDAPGVGEHIGKFAVIK